MNISPTYPERQTLTNCTDLFITMRLTQINLELSRMAILIDGQIIGMRGARPMAARTKKKAKRTKRTRTKRTIRPASRATVKKLKKAKKSAAKKAVAKTSSAKKTVKKKKQGRSTPIKTAATPQAAKAPTPKTAWKISPEISQSVVDIDIWKKDDLKIEHLTVYRSGWIVVDRLPDLSGYDPDEGVNIFEEFEFEEHEVFDGSEETSFFPKELPQEECDRLMTLSEEELEGEGWTIESSTRFSGPLVVEEVAVPSAA